MRNSTFQYQTDQRKRLDLLVVFCIVFLVTSRIGAQDPQALSFSELIQKVRTGTDLERHQAFESLSEMGPKAHLIISDLIDLLGEKTTFTVKVRPKSHHLGPKHTFRVSDRASKVLFQIGEHAVPALVRCITQQDAERSEPCAFVIGGLAKTDKKNKAFRSLKVRQAMDGFYKQNSKKLTVEQVTTLAYTGSKATISGLIQFLDSSSWQERGWAAIGIGELGLSQATAKLRFLCSKDTSSFVRKYAARSLGSLQDYSALDTLIKAMQKDQSSDVRIAAIISLANLRKNKGLQAILKSLNQDPDRKARWEAARVFCTVRYSPAIPVLIRALKKEPHTLTRNAIIAALWSQKAKAALPYLKALIDDPKQKDSHSAAIHAIKVIEGKIKPPGDFANIPVK